MAYETRLGRLMRLIYVLAYCALAATASPILTGRDVLCHEGARICGHQILERGKIVSLGFGVGTKRTRLAI